MKGSLVTCLQWRWLTLVSNTISRDKIVFTLNNIQLNITGPIDLCSSNGLTRVLLIHVTLFHNAAYTLSDQWCINKVIFVIHRQA